MISFDVGLTHARVTGDGFKVILPHGMQANARRVAGLLDLLPSSSRFDE